VLFLAALLTLYLNMLWRRATHVEVYGSPMVHPQTEEYWGNVNPNGPRSYVDRLRYHCISREPGSALSLLLTGRSRCLYRCYDEGKRVAEALTYGYARQDGVDVRVARIFNCFGESSRFPLQMTQAAD
jgi:UDP-glucuronate decarboxylase